MAVCSGEKMDELLATLSAFLSVTIVLLLCVLFYLIQKHKYLSCISKLQLKNFFIRYIYSFTYLLIYVYVLQYDDNEDNWMNSEFVTHFKLVKREKSNQIKFNIRYNQRKAMRNWVVDTKH